MHAHTHACMHARACTRKHSHMHAHSHARSLAFSLPLPRTHTYCTSTRPQNARIHASAHEGTEACTEARPYNLDERAHAHMGACTRAMFLHNFRPTNLTHHEVRATHCQQTAPGPNPSTKLSNRKLYFPLKDRIGVQTTNMSYGCCQTQFPTHTAAARAEEEGPITPHERVSDRTTIAGKSH